MADLTCHSTTLHWNTWDREDRQTREALVRADQEARELRLVEDAEHLPDLAEVRQQIGSPEGARTSLAARDPRVRVEQTAIVGNRCRAG